MQSKSILPLFAWPPATAGMCTPLPCHRLAAMSMTPMGQLGDMSSLPCTSHGMWAAPHPTQAIELGDPAWPAPPSVVREANSPQLDHHLRSNMRHLRCCGCCSTPTDSMLLPRHADGLEPPAVRWHSRWGRPGPSERSENQGSSLRSPRLASNLDVENLVRPVRACLMDQSIMQSMTKQTN